MSDSDDPKNLPDKTSDLLSRTYLALVEGAAGIAASDRESLALSLGSILQRVRGGKFLSQLNDEWNWYREKGRIKDDYLDSEQHYECMQEILDYLDGDSPDHVRFEALKRIFLGAATNNLVDSVLPQQYMRVLRQLSSGGAILLFAEYRAIKKGKAPQDNAHSWLNHMAEESPLKFPELVEMHEGELMEKHLITKRKHSDNSGIFRGFEKHRITYFGYHLCEYIKAESIELILGFL